MRIEEARNLMEETEIRAREEDEERRGEERGEEGKAHLNIKPIFVIGFW